MSDSEGTSVFVYGAGGCGREAKWLAEKGVTPPRRVLGFIDDARGTETREVHGRPVYTLDEVAAQFPGAGVVLAIGSSRVRLAAWERAKASGLSIVSLVSRDLDLDESVTHGEGLVICRNCTCTCDIVLGNAVQINFHCTVAHDAVLEDGVTLAPGAHVSGNVHIGRGAYIGTGAVLIHGHPGKPLRVGAGAIVGAGAVVMRDVPPGVTVVGSPAKPLQPAK